MKNNTARTPSNNTCRSLTCSDVRPVQTYARRQPDATDNIKQQKIVEDVRGYLALIASQSRDKQYIKN